MSTAVKVVMRAHKNASAHQATPPRALRDCSPVALEAFEALHRAWAKHH